MAKGREAFNKKEREKALIKKKKEKERKREERKSNSGKGKGIEDMFAYVDAFGNLVSTPPDPSQKQDVKLKDIQISTARQEKPDSDNPLRTGTVKFFNEAKGYGFITDSETQQSIFVHINNLEDPLKNNDQVTFEIEKGLKGLNAIRVKVISNER